MSSNHDLTPLLRERITFVDGHSDVWPLFYDPLVFGRVVTALAAPLTGLVTKVAGIEARGFILGAAVAARLEVGFVAIRKDSGLYPGEKLTAVLDADDYRGERHCLRLQRAACGPYDAVALVDDWFETGQQARVARTLIELAGARYCGASIIVDQLSEATRRELSPCHSLIAAAELQ